MADKDTSYTGKPKRNPGKTILTIVLILLALIIAAAILDKIFIPSENKDADNTYGSADFGLKAIYLSAKQYLKQTTGAEVERYTKIARFLPEKTAAGAIVSKYEGFSVSDMEDMIRYVENGGVFILVTDESAMQEAMNSMIYTAGGDIFNKIFGGGDIFGDMFGADASFSIVPSVRIRNFESIDPEILEKLGLVGNIDIDAGEDGGGTWISIEYGKGMFMFSNSVEELQNAQLKSEKLPGAKLLVKLEQICFERKIKKVLFDEYYSGIQSDPTPDILGYGFVLCVIELAIAAVIYVIYKGQRFGAPEKVGAEEKRNETEHIDAMAKLYKRTGSGAIGYKIHMEALMEDIGISLGLPEGTPFDDISEAAIASDMFSGSGLDELVSVYKSADNIRFPTKTLDSYIRKMDLIRKERLQ